MVRTSKADLIKNFTTHQDPDNPLNERSLLLPCNTKSHVSSLLETIFMLCFFQMGKTNRFITTPLASGDFSKKIYPKNIQKWVYMRLCKCVQIQLGLHLSSYIRCNFKCNWSEQVIKQLSSHQEMIKIRKIKRNLLFCSM